MGSFKGGWACLLVQLGISHIGKLRMQKHWLNEILLNHLGKEWKKVYKNGKSWLEKEIKE